MDYRQAACRTTAASAARPTTRCTIDLTEPLELMRTLVDHGVAMLNVTLRQPVLQSAHPAAGDLSADRRLPAAGRSARGRRAADRHRAAMQRGVARRADGRHRLLVLCRTICRTSPRPSCAHGWTDFVGLGGWCSPIPSCRRHARRQDAQRKRVCRTFSDCTTAPRNGLISGCYPLDPYYKALPEREQLHGDQAALAVVSHSDAPPATLSSRRVSAERERFI